MLFEDIVILDEIRDELFPLQDEEKRLLEESILKEGIREPLIVWIPQEGPYKGKKILVDGHNRLDVAKRHNLKFKITIKQFSDLEEVLSWVVRNQLGRRNLTDEQKDTYMGSYTICKRKVMATLTDSLQVIKLITWKTLRLACKKKLHERIINQEHQIKLQNQQNIQELQ